MKILHYRLSLPLLLLLACSEPTGPSLTGAWGGDLASLVLSPSGGALSYTCGAGTISQGWIIKPDGEFMATGSHFPGGGPLPPGGRPPRPARYDGRLFGDTLVFTVTLTDTGERLGPFYLRRDGPTVDEMCK